MSHTHTERKTMATEKRKLLSEVPNVGVYPDQETFNKLEPQRQKRDKELLTDAVSDTKSSRDKALENAHNALVDAFGPKVNSMIVEKLSDEDGVTEMDIDELIKELEGAPEDDDMVKECRKRLDEAKNPSVPTSEKEKMYRDIHRKFWAYVQSLPERKFPSDRPLTETDHAVKKFMTGKWKAGIKYLSHEGSIIVSALIAVADGDGAWVSFGQLPAADKELVISLTNPNTTGFWASLDQYKNFECSSDKFGDRSKQTHFTLGNRVASIPPNEASLTGADVKVERKGKDILIGDRIKLEKNRIQNLVNQPDPTNNGANRGQGFVARQKVAGRNAYEIRADVLEMALDWAKSSGEKKMNSDDVLEIAEAFYSFVEHK